MKKIIIANWKMQLSFKDSLILAKELKRKIKIAKNEVVICPDFLALAPVTDILAGKVLLPGAQNCAIKNRGALTGESSPATLHELGVKYVIIGHSERRLILKEDSDLINAKIKSALAAKLIPIVCVGETLNERELGQTKKVLLSQIKNALNGVTVKNSTGLVIAYEPLWAIGTGEPIIPLEAEAIHIFLKAEAAKILGKKIRIAYGGSVNGDNAAKFLREKNVDGLLIGGASLNVDEFTSIVKL
jgi:triosephosphate isomerase